MSSDRQRPTIDLSDALAYVIVRPGTKDGTIELLADAEPTPNSSVGPALRHFADLWAPRDGLLGVLDEVAAERARQDRQWGEQNHPDGTGLPSDEQAADHWRAMCQAAAAQGEVTWAHIAREEDSEAYAESDPALLRAELIQAIAVKVAWVQAIDRRTQAQAGRPS